MKKAILFLLLVLAGCAGPIKKEKEFRYMVFVGSQNLSYGYGTDSYKDSLDYIIFYTIDSTKVIYRKNKILKIEERKKAKNEKTRN